MGCCQSRNIKNLSEKNIDTVKDRKYLEYYREPIVIKNNYKKKVLEEVDNYVKNLPKLDSSFYESLRIICKIKNSHDSSVFLLENDIIMKVYPNTEQGRGQFNNEIETYKHLFNCYFVPNLLHYNKSRLSLFLPYLDSKPLKNEENQKTLNRYLNNLDRKWGIRRLKRYQWDNLRQKNNQIYLIDFGSVPFTYQKYNKRPHWIVL